MIMKTLLIFKDNNTISFNSVITSLVTLNYSRVDIVFEPGHFSVKGDVIDVFPLQHQDPIRLEYDFDSLDRLVVFKASNQKSYADIDSVTISYFDSSLQFFEHQSNVVVDDMVVSNFFDNDFVVHEYYGIGLYKGLVYKQFSNIAGEFICLEYKDQSFVYIPLNQLNVLYPYGHYESPPVLDSLHSNKWNKTKASIERDTIEIAEELFERYSLRQNSVGFKCFEDTVSQLEMESSCDYELTIDQKKVLSEIKSDMESNTPMDRLLCGDVGFGKTEVLLRAAFKAVDNGKQVAILVPTTLLVEQHYELFNQRLSDFPFIIKRLSRFVSKSDQKVIINSLKCHTCDIVIGTHRLLSKDISFGNLGLLIIDEEQRFGVSHKEKIQSLKYNIDVLSVTATPIPRTMYMSLTGSKDVSMIKTPPVGRKSIITKVCHYKESILQEAINFEIARNGQVFFVHNHVRGLSQKVIELRKLFPSCCIEMVHAQLDEETIFSIMADFKSQNIDILVTTSIIENGLDIKHANTIIINCAEQFGLSQIHQLRGRVGRSHIQSYAYLFFSAQKKLTMKANQRMQAIREYVGLGSGYQLALKDLEIRGAGNILGQKQYGHVLKVGFKYYCKLLEQSIGKYNNKSENWLALRTDKIRISEDYISNSRERIAVYIRLMRCSSIRELNEIKIDLKDRYGQFLLDVENVFQYVENQLNLLIHQ